MVIKRREERRNKIWDSRIGDIWYIGPKKRETEDLVIPITLRDRPLTSRIFTYLPPFKRNEEETEIRYQYRHGKMLKSKHISWIDEGHCDVEWPEVIVTK